MHNHFLKTHCLARVATVLVVSLTAVPSVFAQRGPDSQLANQRAYTEKLQQVTNDKAAYATSIVQKWEESARASGRFDASYATDLFSALMKLTPDNLLAAGEATSYDSMRHVLATGRPKPAGPEPAMNPLPNALGDTYDDLVFTPLAPCRIVDTRVAGGPIAANSTRAFDVDGSNFSSQGGSSTGCGIPYDVARAVAMTITVTQPSGGGYFTAWSVGAAQPNASVLNFTAGQTIANTTIVPVDPGVGNDFYLNSAGASSQAIIDVVGYYAAPAATALDCTTVASATVSVPVDQWTAIDASCPAGRTVSGGGYDTTEGTLGYPGVWSTSVPNGANGWRVWVDNQTNGARSMLSYAICCRVPGR